MEVRELDIIAKLLTEVLNKKDYKRLRDKFKTSEDFNEFLNNILSSVVANKIIVGFSFFDEFQQQINFAEFRRSLIVEMANMAAEGYSSKSINSLFEFRDEIFIEYFNFINSLNNSIKYIERAKIKKKLNLLSEMNQFEISDEQIEKSIKLNARNELKNKFIRIEKEIIKADDISYFKYKKVSIIILTISAILLAILFSGNLDIQNIFNSNRQTPELKSVEDSITVISKSDTVNVLKDSSDKAQKVFESEVGEAYSNSN